MAAPASAAKGPKCTVQGTKGKDVLRGTNGRDVICGGAGDDRLVGRAGRDRLVAGEGNDRLQGGPGHDELDGGAGDDTCGAGPGDLVFTNCFTEYTVSELRVSPNPIDTSKAEQDVRISLRLTAMEPIETRISQVTVIRSMPGRAGYSDHKSLPSDDLTLVSGDHRDGLWSGELTVPQHSKKGLHELSLGILRVPRFGQDLPPGFKDLIRLSFRELRRAGLEPWIDQEGLGDDGPPKIKWVRLDPKQIDTSQGDAPLQVTMRVTDNGLGVQRATGGNGELQLISGDKHDGIWSGFASVPRGTPQGRYSLASGVSADDGLYSVGLSEFELAQMGMEHSVHQIGPGERGAPLLTDLEILEPTPQRHTYLVRATIVDDLSGTASMRLWQEIDGGLGGITTPFSQADLVEGTPLNGVWEEEVPESSGPALLTIEISDAFGFTRFVSSAELEAAGLPNSIPP